MENQILEKFNILALACLKFKTIQLRINEPAYAINFNAAASSKSCPENGFREMFCLDNDQKEEVRKIRKKAKHV